MSMGIGEEIHKMEHSGRVVGLAWSGSGDMLVSAGEDRYIHIWYPAGGRVLSLIAKPGTKPTAICLSPDSKLLALGTSSGMIQIFSMKSGTLVHEMMCASSPIEALAWSPSGEYLAYAYGDEIGVWSIFSKECIAILRAHRGAIRDMCWSPKGDILISGGDDKVVHVWRADTWSPMARLSGFICPVVSVAIGPLGDMVAGASKDGIIRVWRAPTWRRLNVISIGSKISAISWGPRRSIICGCEDGGLWLWVIGGEKLMIGSHDSAITSVSWSQERGLMASGDSSGIVKVWSIGSPQTICT